MIRRTPISTRPDPLFPYTALVRSAMGDRQHLAPYSAVELGAARLQRQIESWAVVGEVIAYLRGGLLQKVAAVMATTCRTAPGWTGPGDADDGAVLLGDGDRPGGCVEGEAPTRHGRLAPASRAAASLAGSVIGSEQTVPRQR